MPASGGGSLAKSGCRNLGISPQAWLVVVTWHGYCSQGLRWGERLWGPGVL